MAGGARINGAAAASVFVLGYMRGDVHAPHFCYPTLRIVSLVSTDGHASFTRNAFGHQQRSIPFRRAVALQQLGIHHQTVSILDQHIAQ